MSTDRQSAGEDGAADYTEGRYLDVTLRALDEIVATVSLPDTAMQRYHSVRRTLARLIVDRTSVPGRDELGIDLPHPPTSEMPDDELFSLLSREAWELDGAIEAADERLAAVPSAGGQSQLSAPDIEKALQRAGHASARVRRATTLFGGRSKETILLEVDGLEGIPRDVVLRRDLLLSSLGTTVIHEAPLLRLLFTAGVCVPQPYELVADADLLGSPFLLLERKPGSAGSAGGILGSTTPERLRATARTLASIHRLREEELTGAMSGRAAVDSVHVTDEIESLDAEWRRFNRGDSLTVGAAFRWLRAHIPADPKRRVLVHADYSFHNLLFEGDEITAVLDWELAHVGHPAEDFCYVRPGAEASIGWAAYLEAYREAGGDDIPLESVRYYTLLGTLRLLIQLLRSRDHFEHGRIDDPLKADGSMYWLPRVAQRLAHQLQETRG